MASQTINGKAFEYALLNQFLERLRTITSVAVVEGDPYKTAFNVSKGLMKRSKVTIS